MLRNKAFLEALDTARQHIPIMKSVRRSEYWCGFTIVRHRDNFRVHNADAWKRPSEPSLLPWSPPEGTPVAHVNMSGELTIYPESEMS